MKLISLVTDLADYLNSDDGATRAKSECAYSNVVSWGMANNRCSRVLSRRSARFDSTSSTVIQGAYVHPLLRPPLLYIVWLRPPCLETESLHLCQIVDCTNATDMHKEVLAIS
jgi:hypothetical protein